MRYLTLLLLFVAFPLLGAVDTKDGTAITTSTTLDGETGIDTADGQAIASGAAAPTYLIEQNFEETGLPTGWTEFGTPDSWDYTTSPAPLEGSESVRVTASGQGGYATFTSQSEVWGYFMFNATIAGDGFLWHFYDSTGASLVSRVRILSGGSFRVYNGATDSDGGSWSTSTTYHCWIRYKAGTGSNAETDFWVSSSTTKPGSPTVSITTGTSTDDAGRVAINPMDSGEAIILDKFRVDDENIGSNPS